MRPALTIVLSILFLCSVNAQKYSVTWGDETKMKKATVDMKLVGADKTGVYFLEGDLKMKSYFVVGASFKTAYKLKKFDDQFNEVFEKDYSKDLRDVSLNSIKPLKNKLFLFAHHYNKKENTYSIYGIEIDKTSGELTGELNEVANYTLASDKDDVDYIFKALPDSSGWILVVNITPKDKSSDDIYTTVLDLKLTKKQSATIHLKTDPHFFNFEDIAFTKDNKFLLLGKEYEALDNGRKRKKITLKDYTLTRYSAKGLEEASYKFEANDNRYLIGGKLLPLPSGEIVFAGFYSNTGEIKKQQLNGVYIARISSKADSLVQSSSMNITQNMLTNLSDSIPQDEDNDQADDKSSRRKKDKDDDDGDEGFNNSFVIRNVIANPATNNLVLIAESYKYTYRTYTSSDYNSATHSTSFRTETIYSFANSDLLIINASVDGTLKHIDLIPKKQLESITNAGSTSSGISFNENIEGLFAEGGAYPYYSSISSLVANNKLFIFYNDDDRNIQAKYGDDSKSIKRIYNFKKSVLCALSIDFTSSALTKKIIYDNSDELIAMPRFGYVTGNNVYLPASKQKSFGKTELSIGKISIK